MHPTIDFGLFQLPAMGISILCGTVLAFLLLFLLRKKTRLSTDQSLDGLIWAILLGFVGMKALYWIVTPVELPTNLREVLDFLATGMVFYGGLIGGILGILICSLRKKVNPFEYADYFAPAFCLAHAGGRIGCLLAGCCYGMVVDSAHPFGIVYPTDANILPIGASRLAVPVMEAAFLVLLAAVLSVLFIHRKRRGFVTGIYLLLYSVWRFIIEFFRDDIERGFVGALSTSQWISIATFAAAIVLIVLSFRWKLDIEKNSSISEEAMEDASTEASPETEAQEDIENASPSAAEEAKSEEE